MLEYKIVLLPFPFDDLSGTKVRPAVCLTKTIGEHDHVVVAFITSRTPDDLLDSDIVIAQDLPEFSATGLKVTSTLRLHRIMTISTAIIKRELGALPKPVIASAKEKMRKLFSL